MAKRLSTLLFASSMMLAEGQANAGSYFNPTATVKPHKHYGLSSPAANYLEDVQVCNTDTDCDFRCCNYSDEFYVDGECV